MATYHGYVVHWSGNSPAALNSNSSTFVNRIVEFADIEPANTNFRPASPGWTLLTFISRKPLRGEERRSPDEQWRYLFYVRANSQSNNIIIGSGSRSVTEQLLKSINHDLRPQFRNVGVHVDQLADYLLENPDEKFVMTSMMLDVPKYGTALNTIMLFGDDIAQARDLTSELIEYRARRIGLRLLSSSRESAQIGSNGYVRFYDNRLQGLEHCLAFVRSLNLYVS